LSNIEQHRATSRTNIEDQTLTLLACNIEDQHRGPTLSNMSNTNIEDQTLTLLACNIEDQH
jgi:hypothetical protein